MEDEHPSGRNSRVTASNMVTPQTLRENAAKQLEAAKALVDVHPHTAAYLAGYAIEFVLKARYCRLRKWSTFPDSPDQLRDWNSRDGVQMPGRLFTHNLDELLRLSNSVSIKTGAFGAINWERASDWSAEMRYQPAQSTTTEDARRQIEETERVVDELMRYEVVSELLAIEVDLSNRFGSFYFYGYVEHPADMAKEPEWGLLFSWAAPTQEQYYAQCKELKSRIESLSSDIRARIRFFTDLPPDAPIMRAVFVMQSVFGGVFKAFKHAPSVILNDNLVAGLPPPPNGFILTAGNWSRDSLLEEWARLGRPKN